MLNINRATVLGYAGGDAELRTMQSGDDAASFRVATTRRWKGKDGTPGEATEWHRVVVYGGQVKPVSELVRKGVAVLVEGRVQTRDYKDREGNPRTVTEIVVAGAQGMVNVLARKPKDGGARLAGDAAEEAAPEEAGSPDAEESP